MLAVQEARPIWSKARGGCLREGDRQRAYGQAAATTRFGRHEGRSALDLMAEAANSALAQSGLARTDIDGVLRGYATTFPHLMLGTQIGRASWRERVCQYV